MHVENNAGWLEILVLQHKKNIGTTEHSSQFVVCLREFGLIFAFLFRLIFSEINLLSRKVYTKEKSR